MSRSATTYKPPKQRRIQGSLARNLHTADNPRSPSGHCWERITFGQAAELSGGFSDKQMVEELTRTVVAYLTCMKAETRSSDGYQNEVLVLGPPAR